MFFRVMCWKELREHRQQAIVLTALAALFLTVVMPMLLSEMDFDADVTGAAIVLAGACGLVTGAILLANESETHTQVFLDLLPRQRFSVWMSKAIIGVSITAIQALVLTLAARVVAPKPGGILDNPSVAFIIAYLAGFFGLGCGLFGSALASTVLAAIGWGIVCGFVSGIVALVLASIGAEGHREIGLSEQESADLGLLFSFLLLPSPLVLSGLIYTRPDRRRQAMARPTYQRRRWALPATMGLRSSLWLSLRQGRYFILGVAVAALLSGPLALIDPLAIWPIATLLLGLIMGVAVLGDEQFYGSFRFLAEQRLPLGRLWLVKVGTRLLATVFVGFLMGCTALLAIKSAKYTSWDPFNASRSGYVTETIVKQFGAPTFLLLFLTYGFTFGQMAGMLARKSIIAVAIGLPAAIIGASIWLPSLVSGGFPAWELFVIPIGLLFVARLLLWSWATDRLLSRRALIAQGFAVIVGIAFVGLCLAKRVWEIPAVAPPPGIDEFAAGYPTRDQNPVRSALFRASERFQQAYAPHQAGFEGFELEQSDSHVKEPSRRNAADLVLLDGWPKNDALESSLLSQMTKNDWLTPVRECANLPQVPAEDPRDGFLGSTQWLTRLPAMGQWLSVEALHRQALGHHGEALDLIIAQLAVARDVQTKASRFNRSTGDRVERDALLALARWSENPNVSTELLEKALQETRNHEAKRPPASDVIMAEYLLMREYANSADAGLEYSSNSKQDWTRSLVALARQVPWERVRRERLVNAYFEQIVHVYELDSSTIPEMVYRHAPSPLAHVIRDDLVLSPYSWYGLGLNRERTNLCNVRAAQVSLALLAYQRRNGTAAKALSDLVPRYLPQMPIDPFSGAAFHYRLADSEEWIKWEEDVRIDRADEWGIRDLSSRTPSVLPLTRDNARRGEMVRRVHPGTGVIWSIGSDCIDNGGTAQQIHDYWYGADMIFLVAPSKSFK